jgi:hypothetical protein
LLRHRKHSLQQRLEKRKNKKKKTLSPAAARPSLVAFSILLASSLSTSACAKSTWAWTFPSSSLPDLFCKKKEKKKKKMPPKSRRKAL